MSLLLVVDVFYTMTTTFIVITFVDILFFFFTYSLWYIRWLWIFPVVLQIYKNIQSPAAISIFALFIIHNLIFRCNIEPYYWFNLLSKMISSNIESFSFFSVCILFYELPICIFCPYLRSWCFTNIYRNDAYIIKFSILYLKFIKYFHNLIFSF